ncbi:hypothetical protein AAFF_G00222490 [Aldrovandia affinis]|uniref:Uncharacterized protein n=1 Tax=Aldrovandia affinis TaxID=143900 RepID=A0AAD7RFA9_9TELE|nr:hypothetical protein AAFF_G00222490 [Aldrovandia affinis]
MLGRHDSTHAVLPRLHKSVQAGALTLVEPVKALFSSLTFDPSSETAGQHQDPERACVRQAGEEEMGRMSAVESLRPVRSIICGVRPQRNGAGLFSLVLYVRERSFSRRDWFREDGTHMVREAKCNL